MSDLTQAGTALSEPPPPSGPDGSTPGPQRTERNASLWAAAGRLLVRKPVFMVSLLYVLVVSSMAAFPTLWTSQDPRDCDVRRSQIPPSAEHPFGYNILGCDYYAFNIYGARPSLVIAIAATTGIVLIGGVLGMLAGYFGGWIDTIISRVIDVFLALPFLIGAIVFLTVIKRYDIITVGSVLIILGWTTLARLMRGSVIASKNLDYVQAAKALGASNTRLMFRHVLPNAVAPVIVIATILLGAFVAAEATLTFLGVGLQPPEESWGIAISVHQVYFLESPWLLAFPCALLVGTVLAFILMGDALRDALDPKLR
jgi:peptide/nickel transport system permease protein/oligopeptide transport system permease protein